MGAFDDLVGKRVQVIQDSHECQGQIGTVMFSGCGNCADIYWPEFSLLIDGEKYTRQFKERDSIRVIDNCSRCSGLLVDHEVGPNPSWKCVSCGVIQ